MENIKQDSSLKKTFIFSFKKSIPVMLGYLFMGFASGILLNEAGYDWFWSLISSVSIVSGTMQFVLADFLKNHTAIITVILMTFIINFRYMFYGLSFIEKFNKMKTKYYMIFSLTDETYSIMCSFKETEGVDLKKASFLLAFLDHMYWVIGCVSGGIAGSAIKYDLTGIDFSMTALFIVILVEQWQTSKSRLPQLFGFLSAAVFLILLGPDSFLLPSIIVTVTLIMLSKPKIIAKEEVDKK